MLSTSLPKPKSDVDVVLESGSIVDMIKGGKGGERFFGYIFATTRILKDVTIHTFSIFTKSQKDTKNQSVCNLYYFLRFNSSSSNTIIYFVYPHPPLPPPVFEPLKKRILFPSARPR